MNHIKNCNFSGMTISGNKIIKDGVEYEIPKHVKGTNISVINNKIFINGYEFKNGKWVKTLRALWHKWF